MSTTISCPFDMSSIRKMRTTHKILHTSGVFDVDNRTLVEVIAVRRALLYTSPTFAKLYQKRVISYLRHHGIEDQTTFIVGASGEEQKRYSAVDQLLQSAHLSQLGRRDLIIAIGGGIVCDIAGFAASIYRRGIPNIKIPTTLLGLVDAGIGLKNGINSEFGKNKIGTFSAPDLTIIDPSLIVTLPKVEMSHGISEILKMGIAVDRGIYDLLKDRRENIYDDLYAVRNNLTSIMIKMSVDRMQSELVADPYETGTLYRRVDFGHTFSPIMEAELGYQIPHGAAVSLDMALSLCLARNLDFIDAELFKEGLSTFKALALPIDFTFFSERSYLNAIESAVLHRDGKLSLPLPYGEFGSLKFVDDPQLIDLSLRDVKAMIVSEL